MRVKDCGESESLAVMAGTGIEHQATSFHVKTGRLPHGALLHEA